MNSFIIGLAKNPQELCSVLFFFPIKVFKKDKFFYGDIKVKTQVFKANCYEML